MKTNSTFAPVINSLTNRITILMMIHDNVKDLTDKYKNIKPQA